MPKVSIVVPVYKVEKYLERCVDSLRNQTLRDLEIILVDDGSPDSCPALCDALAREDSRIRVVHKPNGGLSSARNAGLRIAEGKYVGFVDSDDDCEKDMYEKLCDAMERERVDFAMSDYLRFPAQGKPYLKSLDIPEGRYDKDRLKKEIYPNLIMRECVDYGPLLSVWHCLYRTEFLRSNHLEFDEEVRCSEDNIFSAQVGYLAESFYYLKGEGLYHYYQNPGTITTAYRPGAWEVYSTMNHHLHAFFDGRTDYDFSRQLKLHMMYYACNCIGQACGQPKEIAIPEIRKILKSRDLKVAFQNFPMPEIPVKLKLQLLLMKHGCAGVLYRIISRRS